MYIVHHICCIWYTWRNEFTVSNDSILHLDAYLIQVPQGRVLIRGKVLISLKKNSRMCKRKLGYLFEKNRKDWKTDLLSMDPSWINSAYFGFKLFFQKITFRRKKSWITVTCRFASSTDHPTLTTCGFVSVPGTVTGNFSSTRTSKHTCKS